MVDTDQMSDFTDRIEQIDRPRGILSKSDRRFLLNESYREGLEPQSRRNIRSRIRERLRHAIIDFYVLDGYLDDRDRNQVFSEIDGLLKEGLHGNLAILFKAAGQNERTFEAWIEGGLTHIELEMGENFIVEQAEVELSITPEMQFLLWRANNVLGGIDSEDPIFGILGIFADWFEDKTRLGDVKDKGDDNSEYQEG